MNSKIPDKSTHHNSLENEYEHVVDLLKYSSQMIWTGYGAFFAANSLLATGYGLIFSRGYSNGFTAFVLFSQIVISITGLFISLVAISVILTISYSQRALIARGLEIERQTGAMLMTIFVKIAKGFPWATVLGSCLFSVFWLASIVFASIRWWGI